ncbi:MAG: fimbrial biogenesis chaperone [Spirochaetota bacterium]
MKYPIFVKVLLIVLSFYLILKSANAGSFSAVPAKVYLSSDQKSAVLKIKNDGGEKLTLQVNTVKWIQDEKGNDRFEDTDEIVYFPRIITLEKGEEKLLRIGYKSDKTMDREKTFRLFIRELPVSKPGERMLKVTLRLAIPVFISPKKIEKKIELERIEISNMNLLVRVTNLGNSHVLVERIVSTGYDDKGGVSFKKETPGWYILAGLKRTFSIELSEEECLNTRSVKVTVKSEDLDEVELNTEMNGSGCVQSPTGL